MSVRVKRVYRRRGLSRYRVGFGPPLRGMPVEFLIESAPQPQSREWRAVFARALAQALLTLAEYEDGQTQ